MTLERDPAGPQGRGEAVGRLFQELHRVFVERVGSIVQTLTARPWGRVAAGGAQGGGGFEFGPLRVSKERALLEGVAFFVETRDGVFRFLNTFSGVIWVHAQVGETLECREVITVQLTPEGYQPIRKAPSSGRSGFRFTSVRELVDGYLSHAG